MEGGTHHRRSPFAVELLAGPVAVVAVRGLTHGTDAAELAGHLEVLADDGCRRFVVDLSGTRLLNSKLLDALVRFAARLDPRRGDGLAVVTDTAYVRHMLEVGAEGGVLLLTESRDDALDAVTALGR